MRRFSESVAVLALLAAATVVFTWPLAAHLGSAVTDPGDPLFTSWILAWDAHVLVRAPLRLFDANIFHPHRLTLAYSEHLLGLLPLAAPVRLAGGGPVLAHNVVLLATFPLAGVTMFLLVFHLTRDAGAGVVAALLYAFSHYRFGQLGHVQVLSHEWLPLLLLGLHRAVAHAGRWRDVALISLAFTVQALSSAYHAFFAAIAVVLSLLWVAGPAGRPPLGRTARRALVAGACVALLLGPFAIPYHLVRHRAGFERSINETQLYSARPSAFLTIPYVNRWVGDLTGAFRRPEGQLFPGVILLLLAATGAVTAVTRLKSRDDPSPIEGMSRLSPAPRRAAWSPWLDRVLAAALVASLANALVLGGFDLRGGPLGLFARDALAPLLVVAVALLVRRLIHGRPVPLAGLAWLRRLAWPNAPGFYVGLTAVAVLCSFGPTLYVHDTPVAQPLYRQLYALVPGVSSLRVPARFAVLVNTGLAVLAGYGVATIVAALPPTGIRRGAVTVLGALALLETCAVPLPLFGVPPVGPADLWLAEAPRDGAVVHLPLYPERNASLEASRLLGSTTHWRPLVNGYSGFSPPGYWETVEMLNAFPAPEAVARLRALDVRYVVIYLGQLQQDARARIEGALPTLPPGITRAAEWPDTVLLEVGPPP